MLKICHVCGKEKEHKSWKATTCNDCLDAGLKWCSACGQTHPVSNFHKNGHTTRSFCKTCEIRRSTDSKAASGYYKRPEVRARRNEDSRLCKTAKYKFDDAYRAAELARCHDRRTVAKGDLTPAQWIAACEAFDFKCAYCGSAHKITMDHFIACTKGGKTSADNIIPACQSCNSSKQDKDAIEWFSSQPFYSYERVVSILKYLKGVKPCQP